MRHPYNGMNPSHHHLHHHPPSSISSSPLPGRHSQSPSTSLRILLLLAFHHFHTCNSFHPHLPFHYTRCGVISYFVSTSQLHLISFLGSLQSPISLSFSLQFVMPLLHFTIILVKDTIRHVLPGLLHLLSSANIIVFCYPLIISTCIGVTTRSPHFIPLLYIVFCSIYPHEAIHFSHQYSLPFDIMGSYIYVKLGILRLGTFVLQWPARGGRKR